MSATRPDGPPGEAGLTLVRTFDAPPERVWAAWTDPEQLARWLHDDPAVTTLVHALDARPGGALRLTIPPDEPTHPDLGSYAGLFLVVDAPRELGLCVVDPGRWACAMVRARFAREGTRTRMVFHSTLHHESARDATATAWSRCFDHLASLLTPLPRT